MTNHCCTTTTSPAVKHMAVQKFYKFNNVSVMSTETNDEFKNKIYDCIDIKHGKSSWITAKTLSTQNT